MLTHKALHERFGHIGWPTLGFLLITFAAGSSLLQSNFHYGHDNALNVIRLAEFRNCLTDGMWFCRWAPRLGNGLGQPIFQFYPTLPIWVGVLFGSIGVSLPRAVDLSSVASIFVGLVCTYLLARQLSIQPWGAWLVAVLVAWSPYRAYSLCVRGALSEAWAQALLPLPFAASLALSKSESVSPLNVVFLAVSWLSILLSHQLMLIMVAPFYFGWLLVISHCKKRQLLNQIIAHALVLPCMAFRVVPLAEATELTHIVEATTTGMFDFRRHFYLNWHHFIVPSRQSWPARPGIVLVIMALCSLALSLRFRTLKHKNLMMASFAGSVLVVGLMSSRSQGLVWEHIPWLPFVQFPWRFVGLLPTFLVICTAPFWQWLQSKPVIMRFCPVAALTIAPVVSVYYAPSLRLENPVSLADAKKLTTTDLWHHQHHGASDYLPKAVDLRAFHRLGQRTDPIPIVRLNGNGMILSAHESGNRVIANIETVTRSEVVFSTAAYPGWTALVDGQVADWRREVHDSLGRIRMDVDKGSHRLELRLEPRLRDWISFVISAVALCVIAAFAAWRRWRLPSSLGSDAENRVVLSK